jgi:hypothetical protein
MNMEWAYGVTTVPSRHDALLGRVLPSLAVGGVITSASSFMFHYAIDYEL